MLSPRKNQEQILRKLGIDQLNSMQEEAALAVAHTDDVIILSPTGSGKTLAFLLPLLAQFQQDSAQIQCMVVVPSRELAIQIETVARDMGTGYKVNAIYGGRPVAKDLQDLQHPPTLLIGTPGRLADHLKRRTFSTKELKYLVLDEFDKSLEIGFSEEMSAIVEGLPRLEKRVLTSATQAEEWPDFLALNNPTVVDHLNEGNDSLAIKSIISPDKDKLHTLGDALRHLGAQPGIIFCNYKDSIQRVSDFLSEQGISHACFYGGMEQKERERSLIKFRNGTHQLLLATDLAARGIDVPEIKFIIHYHLPHHAHEFTHRNGRTARMHRQGTAYVLHWKNEQLPDFIGQLPVESLQEAPALQPSPWTTVFISGGRRDKISKGDIAGLLFKKGQLSKDDLGIIELKVDCAFVAVKRNKLKQLLSLVDNGRIKKRKVRVYEI
ncbi:MAG: DEAD/DEAH box helicase [Bacteroidota bacterium]